MSFIEKAMLGAIIGLIGAALFLGFQYAKASESCLEMGFDKYRVTWNFRVFCVGYDGVLRPVVKEAK